MEPQRYIGMMSGTSLDGIDAVVLEVNEHSCRITHTAGSRFPDKLRAELSELIRANQDIPLEDMVDLHIALAGCYAEAVNTLLEKANLSATEVAAVGNHGQTVRHCPDANPPYSLQLGDPQRLADLTGITVVGNFRQADLDLGGQGAPLVPAFHNAVFAKQAESRAAVNIGGIANITLLPEDGAITGFDTGPGNTLMDEWTYRHHQRPYDYEGQWAASGQVNPLLLAQLASDLWLQSPPPKSTGREYFNLQWLDTILNRLGMHISPADVQATLCELTAATIAKALLNQNTPTTVAVCGGGAHNLQLMRRLRAMLPEAELTTTADWGIDPDWVEAAAFAWLADARLKGVAGNVPSVTGASGATLLGDVFQPANRA